jgi:hypothetical protein
MLAIRNFGHFWSRDHVNWGSPSWGKKANLLGYFTRNRQPYIVDFQEQIGIYVLFASSREVVYIGQTGSGKQRLGVRLRQHTQNDLRDRWKYFSWFGFRQANLNGNSLSNYQKPNSKSVGSNSDALDEIEAILIQLFEPRLNKQGPKWGSDTKKFFQYIPAEWVKPEKHMSNEQLLEELKKHLKQKFKKSSR